MLQSDIVKADTRMDEKLSLVREKGRKFEEHWSKLAKNMRAMYKKCLSSDLNAHHYYEATRDTELKQGLQANRYDPRDLLHYSASLHSYSSRPSRWKIDRGVGSAICTQLFGCIAAVFSLDDFIKTIDYTSSM